MNDLTMISHHLMIIIGIPMYIFGCMGNLLNIYVFYIWSRLTRSIRRNSNRYRLKNSSLYLLISSISNLIVIIYPLLTRIIFDGFKYTVTRKNRFVFCQLRFSILHTFDLISLTCICMATCDRYLISSRQVHLRHLIPTRKQTKQIILVIICFFSLHSIPIGLYFNVSKFGQCEIQSKFYLYYYLWSTQILFRGIFPIVFLTIVCFLTFQQMKRFDEKNQLKCQEKQFSRMLFLISFAIILSSIPYCIEHISYVMFSQEFLFDQSPAVYFYHVISSILFYTNAVTSFYIFFISTPNFRIEIKNFLFCQTKSRRIKIVLTGQTFR